MPFKDPEKERENARKRKAKYRRKKHEEKYGPGVGSMKGRHGKQVTGSKHYRWNKNKIMASHWYVLIRTGKSHPLAAKNGYSYEHLMVWLTAGNEMPKDNEVIHHKNGDKQDNRIDNLEIKTLQEHGRLHHELRQQAK